LDDLKRRVCEANLELLSRKLVIETFGNASAIDRDSGSVVIKPSGVPYDRLGPEHMVVVSAETGAVAEGDLRPSSDTPTHLELYRAFAAVGGIVHTHSLYATAWAQAGREIPPLGTTHADYFAGAVPLTRPMTAEEVQSDYEVNTGKVIVERFAKLDPLECPGVLVVGHGPFAWGTDVEQAVHHAAIVEALARLASETLSIEPYPRPVSSALHQKHFRRKHGPDSYYGQKDKPGQ